MLERPLTETSANASYNVIGWDDRKVDGVVTNIGEIGLVVGKRGRTARIE
jgi:hypothetical protein